MEVASDPGDFQVGTSRIDTETGEPISALFRVLNSPWYSIELSSHLVRVSRHARSHPGRIAHQHDRFDFSDIQQPSDLTVENVRKLIDAAIEDERKAGIAAGQFPRSP